MRAPLAALLLLGAGLAGCLATPDGPLAAQRAQEAPLLLDDEGRPAADGALRWNGTLSGARETPEQASRRYGCWAGAPCDPAPLDCREGACERRAFRVGEGAGALELTLRWPTQRGVGFEAWIEDDAGTALARTAAAYPDAHGRALRLDAPAPGRYHVAVVATRGGATYEAAVRAAPAPPADADPARELLPDIVTLPPTDLSLETPDYAGLSYFVFPVPGLRPIAEALGTKGCRVDEVAEYSARRCLRFSNAVGNVGEGPLDVRLRPLAAGLATFEQRVLRADGTWAARAGGAAEWHATHAHWHNAAANRFTLHAYDLAAGEVGEPLGEGRKGGICFADVGIVDVSLPHARPSAYGGWGCLQPDRKAEWWMGISPGWYDLYPFLLAEQYVDVTGVSDGDYALCSATNEEGSLAEADLSNNVGCTPFRLEGDTITLLAPAPYHATRGRGG